MSVDEREVTIPRVGAGTMLKAKRLWLFPVVVGSVLVGLMTLIYFGAFVDPVARLHGLPVLVVNEDSGPVGAEVAKTLATTPAITRRLSITEMTLAQAHARMDRDDAYVTVVIPPGFTSSTAALTSTAPDASKTAALPQIELLTNNRAGSLGISLAEGVLNPALSQISHGIGAQLDAHAPPGLSPASRALLTDPVRVAPVVYRPLPSHAGVGLSAFYMSLLIMMAGFLGAIIINTGVDSALGYATSEIGPWWRQRLPVRISRWHTLLVKWAMAVPCTLLFTGVLVAVATGILRLDAPHLLGLWMFAWYAAAVIAFGTLVLFAALGALGQIIALLLFVYLALASSGGTIPLQALNGFYRFVANFEPLRQIVGAVRSLLYFNGIGAAGLTRGLVLTSVGLVLWLIVGAGVTNWYDRRGLDRMSPELMEHIYRTS